MKKLLFTALLTFSLQTIFSQVTNGLVGHFKLDGTAYTDETGNQNGSLSTAGNQSLSSTSDKSGTLNSALKFNGGSITAGSNLRGISDEVTVSLWLKLDANIDIIRFIITKYYCTQTAGFTMQMAENRIVFAGRDNSSNAYMSSGLTDSLLLNNWYHIVGVCSSNGTWSIWKNGELENSNNYNPINSLESDCNLTIGSIESPRFSGQTVPYLGNMDEVRIYNRALDSLEIDTLYNYPYATASLEKEIETNYRLYPNPTEGNVTVSGLTSDIRSISVLGLDGREISEIIVRSTSKERIIELPPTSGIYFLRFRSEDGNYNYQKVIKN